MAGREGCDSHKLEADVRKVQSLRDIREIDCGVHGCY